MNLNDNKSKMHDKENLIDTLYDREFLSDDEEIILSDGFDLNIKLLDIDKDETKSLEKQDGTNYVFFSQKCSVNGSEVEQYDIKKLTSDSISITNLGDDLARIVLITR